MAKTTETNAGTISYSVRGSGPPLVLLPGFQSSSVSWVMYGYPEHLTSYRAIMIDPLGHGKSQMSHDPTDYEIEATIGQVLAVLDAEGIDRAPFAGFSRGGLIVANMFNQCPDRMTAGIIGAAPLGSAFRATMNELASGLPALRAGDWASYWASYPVPLPPELQQVFEQVNDPMASGAALQAMIEWPDDAGLMPSDVPRLAYFGTGEVFADGLRAELVAHDIEYVERGWAGHAETMSDASGVSTIINNFLAER